MSVQLASRASLVTHLNQDVSNRDVIPVVAGSAVFSGEERARFAAGIIAVNGSATSGLHAEYMAHFELRKRVYLDQTAQLAATDIQDDGTDRDSDDARSITFAVFENTNLGTRVVGVSRIIVRGEHSLPIEISCPEVFAFVPVSAMSVEISRVIARHEKAGPQAVIQHHLFAMMLAYVANHRLSRTFAIVEPWLERHLSGVIAIDCLGEARYVEHYLDYNLPIEIDIRRSTERVERLDVHIVSLYQSREPALRSFGRVSQASAPVPVH